MAVTKKLYQHTPEEYLDLIRSGELETLYPEATGTYHTDIIASKNGKFKIEQDICKICNNTGELPNGGAGDTWSDLTCNCKKDE